MSCVNYQKLNTITFKDQVPIPLVEDLLDMITHACWLSKLDLQFGFHKIRIHDRISIRQPSELIRVITNFSLCLSASPTDDLHFKVL